MKLIRKLDTRPNKNGHKVRWAEFLCEIPECDKIVVRRLSVGKRQKSCGCLMLKNKYGLKHGGTNTRLYEIYLGIKGRCFNYKCSIYKYYGGRGITICPEWANDYTKFRDWSLNNGYTEGLEIHRENDGNYEPNSCKWVTHEENAQKRSNTKLNKNLVIEIREKHKTGNFSLEQLAKEYNVNNSTIYRVVNYKRWNNII